MAFFLLKDATGFQALVLRLMPQGRSRWRAADFITQVNEVLATYVRVQLLVALTVAVASGLLLALCGIQFWLLLAGAAAILEFIPMLGPATFTIAASLIAGSQGRGIPVLLGLIALRMVVDYLVSPALIRQGLRLHPLAILLALLCGSQLAGVAGLFLAIPLMAVGVVTYRYVLLQSGSTGLLASLLQGAEPSDVPALVLATAGEAVRESSDPFLKGVVVLVVDNEADARETVALVLQTYGARVIEADCGARAMEILQSDRPDVLVSDIGMPREDGLDLIRKLRALPSALRSIPAIALTGYGSTEDRDRILAAGFQLYLRKPVSSEELGRAVQDLLRTRDSGFTVRLSASRA
jgi:CheY-like chemotaxis protein